MGLGKNEKIKIEENTEDLSKMVRSLEEIRLFLAGTLKKLEKDPEKAVKIMSAIEKIHFSELLLLSAKARLNSL